jgi:transposase
MPMNYDLIEQLLDLPRIRIRRVEKKDDEIYIWIYVPEGNHICPKCGTFHRKVSEITEMQVRDLPIFGKKCYLIIQKGRLHCPCSFRGYEDFEFADPYKRQTLRFTEFLFSLCDRMTIMDASELLQVNWKQAYKTDKETLALLKSSTPLPKMTVIGVDEISFQKYHKYFTIVYDISDSNAVLFVAKDRKAASLTKFFKKLTEEQKKSIQVVCMDFWDPFIKSVKENIPHAEIVFDRYHLKKHLNDCIDQLRRNLLSEADTQQKSVLKNKRWVLLKNSSNHTQKDKASLEELKNINMPLYEAYLLKEKFDNFFSCLTKQKGIDFIKNWFEEIPDKIKKFFQPFYDLIMRYLDGVFSYLSYRYTNSIAEGINNKIKVLKRMAYGYRDEDYFKLKILRRCGYLRFAKPVFGG